MDERLSGERRGNRMNVGVQLNEWVSSREWTYVEVWVSNGGLGVQWTDGGPKQAG